MLDDFSEKYQLVKNKLNKAVEWINYLNKKQKNLEERIEALEQRNLANNSLKQNEVFNQENIIENQIKEEKISDVKPAFLENRNQNEFSANNDANSDIELETPQSEVENDNSNKFVSLEEKIGSNWFAVLGILALILGVGFFIKYSFEMNWINHLTRIIFGLLMGAGLIFGGEWVSQQQKYKNWGQTLVGGGLATIYFSIFAAYHFVPYREAIGINQITDIFLLMAVVIGSVLVSLKKDSKIIASEAFFLGYMTTLLANKFDFLSLMYGLLLTLGLVTVVAYKKWEVIGLGGMLASYFIFLPWSLQNNSFALASLILIIYFLSFVFQFSVNQNDEDKESFNMFGFCLNAFFFFSLFYSQFKNYLEDNFSFEVLRDSAVSLISNSQLNQVLAIVPLGLAVFFLVLYSFFKLYYSRRYLDLLNYLSLFFITIAISIYFSSGVTTIFWLLEFILLLSGFIKTKNILFKNSALILGFVTGLKLLLMDLITLKSWEASDFQDPRRFMILIFGLITFYLASYLLNKNKELFTSSEDNLSKLFSIVGFVLVLLFIFLEIDPINLILTPFSLLIAFIILLLMFYQKKSGDYFIESNFVFILLLGNLISHSDISAQNINYLFFILMTVFLAGISYYLGYLVKNKFFQSRFETRGVANLYNYSGAILLLFLISNQFSGALISLFWGLLALVVLAFGFALSDKDLRLQSFAVLGLVVFKVFIIDVSELEIVYRIFSYFILGLILLLVSFVYNRNKDKLKDLF